MDKQKLIEQISKRLFINGVWKNHGMTGGCLMISVSEATKIVEQEIKKVK